MGFLGWGVVAVLCGLFVVALLLLQFWFWLVLRSCMFSVFCGAGLGCFGLTLIVLSLVFWLGCMRVRFVWFVFSVACFANWCWLSFMLVWWGWRLLLV